MVGIIFFSATIANKKLDRSIKAMKYILYKHKPGKSKWFAFGATTAWKGYKDQSNQRSP